LPDIEPAADDVAAHQVGIHTFQIGGKEHPSRQNGVEKSRGEALDLTLESSQHVNRRCIGNMTIRPRNVLPGGSASRIKQAGLDQQNKRPLARATLTHRRFRGGDFLECSPQVNRGGAQTFCRLPRNRAMQRVIHFEHSRSVAEAGQSSPLGR